MPDDVVRVIYLCLVHALAIPTTLFPIFYLRSNWQATREGIAQMISGISFAVFVDYVILNFWFHFFRDGTVVGAVAACIVVLGLVVARTYLFILLRKAQRRNRQETGHE